MNTNEFMSEDWLKEWASKNCKSSEELDSMKLLAMLETNNVLKNVDLDNNILTKEEIVISEKDFKDSKTLGFATALNIIGHKFSYTDDITVMYRKPEQPDGSVVAEIVIQNQELVRQRKEEEKANNNKK